MMRPGIESDHWQTLYPLGQWAGYTNNIYYILFVCKYIKHIYIRKNIYVLGIKKKMNEFDLQIKNLYFFKFSEKFAEK